MRWVVLVGCCCCCAGHLERSAIGAPLARALLPRAPPVLLCTVHREEEERNGKRPNAPAAAAAVTAAAAAATRQSQQVQSQPAQPQQAQPQQAQPQQAQQQQAQQQQAQQQQAPLEPPEPHQPPPPLQSTLESAQAEAVADAAGGLLDALDDWLREQTVASVLSKDQAKALLADLRDDRRFWAQQRRQFSLLWVSVEEGMRSEDRPLRSVLGPATTSRLLDALEQMDDDPALVNAVLRSEVVERLLGHVLYEGIFEFIQRVDLLGNVINTLPVLGVIRMQMVKTARTQLDALLGDQIARFLGEYTASAAESAATYLLSDDTAEARRIARRKAGEKVLSKPIGELVEISDLEMFLVRDAVWSAVQEFRLPHEDALVDRLYMEFGHQPFTILLPSNAAAARGDAPLFERGRDILSDILIRFIQSDEWSHWCASDVAQTVLTERARPPPVAAAAVAAAASDGGDGGATAGGGGDGGATAAAAAAASSSDEDGASGATSPPQPPLQAWDGWD